MSIELPHLELHVFYESSNEFSLLCVFLRLHFLFLRSRKFHLLLRRFLLADLVAEKLHQVLNFVDLARDLVLLLVLICQGLIKLVVGFLHFSDGLCGSD